MRKSAAFAAAFVGLAALACSAKPPEIVGLRARVELHALEKGGAVERLSVFVTAGDEDGRDDLDRMHVIHDASERYWTLTRDDWILREEGSDIWIGANDLALEDGGSIPRGRWRVVLLDSGGERAVRDFTVAAPPSQGYPVPTAKLSGGMLVVDSAWPQVSVAFLDGTDALVRLVSGKTGENDLDALYGSREWRERAASVAVRAFDPQRDFGVWSWPVKTNP
ncbi:MAG TPA: hypothetical protein PKW82_11830 [Spirochaetales bacterium]|nr:hypothetical protein [Spirochaetales bacterium]